jgi:hypothetical protein
MTSRSIFYIVVGICVFFVGVLVLHQASTTIDRTASELNNIVTAAGGH